MVPFLLDSQGKSFIHAILMYSAVQFRNLQMSADMLAWLQISAESLQASNQSNDMAHPSDHAGVFVGIQQMEYGAMASPYLAKIGPFSATGTPFSVSAGRLSFTFGLKGPAVSHS